MALFSLWKWYMQCTHSLEGMHLREKVTLSVLLSAPTIASSQGFCRHLAELTRYLKMGMLISNLRHLHALMRAFYFAMRSQAVKSANCSALELFLSRFSQLYLILSTQNLVWNHYQQKWKNFAKLKMKWSRAAQWSVKRRWQKQATFIWVVVSRCLPYDMLQADVDPVCPWSLSRAITVCTKHLWILKK